jgi:hypothetical protein
MSADRPRTSMDDMVKAAERELRLRLHVYPRRVANGQMTQALADRETRAMEDIAETLRGLQQSNRLI